MSKFNVGDHVQYSRTGRNYRILYIQGDRPGVPTGERTLWLESLPAILRLAPDKNLTPIPEGLAPAVLTHIKKNQGLDTSDQASDSGPKN